MTSAVIVPPRCRVCRGTVQPFLDLGRQPLSDRFLTPDEIPNEHFFELRVGQCESCSLVQLLDEVPRDLMFHDGYPFHASGSSVMREHFSLFARRLMKTELTRQDSFAVEIGCNDGVMLRTLVDAGVRHLGFEPAGEVADIAREAGVRVLGEFFEEQTAKKVRDAEGRADVIYAANTLCHIPYLESVFSGIDVLLSDDGVFVFEDPYFGDILEQTAFDQIYDEHFYFFTARSVLTTANRFGFDLIDVEHLPVHGGEIRYTLARAGAREATQAVVDLLAVEEARFLTSEATLRLFAKNVDAIRSNLREVLFSLRAGGHRVVGYGATAKSATVTNFCDIGPDLVSYVCDSTPAKHNRLTPGKHIPVLHSDAFRDPYPDYALLFAWNHANEIMSKEIDFRHAGGKWLLYVPNVHMV